jgi:hypothetical protein
MHILYVKEKGPRISDDKPHAYDLDPGQGEWMWVHSFPDVAKGVDSRGRAGLFHVWIIAAGMPYNRG